MSTAVSINVDDKAFPAVDGRGRVVVLRDVTLDVEAGSFVVISGPSGCGKTTLLNVVAGLDDDFEGEVTFSNNKRPLIAYMFQAPRLLPWRTVRQNIELVLGNKDDPRRANVSDMLKRVDLVEEQHAYPERLSLGMQRRVALARAFILEPDILLMDEPFVSLDDDVANKLRKILFDMWSRRPPTVLFVTHDRMEAVRLGTRLVLVNGKPATIVRDEPVGLSPEQRRDEDAVMAERKRLFENFEPVSEAL